MGCAPSKGASRPSPQKKGSPNGQDRYGADGNTNNGSNFGSMGSGRGLPSGGDGVAHAEFDGRDSPAGGRKARSSFTAPSVIAKELGGGPVRVSGDLARDGTRTHNNYNGHGSARASGSSNGGKEGERLSEPRQSWSDPNVYGDRWPSWLQEFAGEALVGWMPRLILSYQKISKVGRGTYSTVYKAFDLHLNIQVALKKIRLESMDRETLEFMAREIVILRKLNHPNIIKLLAIASSREKGTLYLVFEYVEHDLAGLLSATEKTVSGGFRLGQIKGLMLQLFSALEHCHSNGVLHRDVKGSNLLIDNEGNLKIADFGLAIHRLATDREPLTNRVITLWYRPPELLLGSTQYDNKVDLWSAGCILAELLHGAPILPGQTEVEQLHKIFKLCGSDGAAELVTQANGYAIAAPPRPYPRRISEVFAKFPKEGLALVDQLLSLDPKSRGSAKAVMESAFFTSSPQPEPLNLTHIPNSHEYIMRQLQLKQRESGGPPLPRLSVNKGNGAPPLPRLSVNKGNGAALAAAKFITPNSGGGGREGDAIYSSNNQENNNRRTARSSTGRMTFPMNRPFPTNNAGWGANPAANYPTATAGGNQFRQARGSIDWRGSRGSSEASERTSAEAPARTIATVEVNGGVQRKFDTSGSYVPAGGARRMARMSETVATHKLPVVSSNTGR